MSLSIKFTFTALIVMVWACGFSTEKRRPEKIQKTFNQREVKKVSEADIINRTKKLGDSISQKVGAIFIGKISEQFISGGYKSAAKYCSMNAYPLTDSLAKEYKIFLKRVSSQYRNPQNSPSALEMQVLEAYEYSVEHSDEIGANVQFIRPGDTILYNKPIRISSKLCLNCHGNQTQISGEIKAILEAKYPDDKATGYKEGDLRGMWSLKFLKKEIVQGL